jgi:hypothetical protein
MSQPVTGTGTGPKKYKRSETNLHELAAVQELNPTDEPNCYKVRMTIKSEFTKILLNKGDHMLYGENQIPLNEYIHNDIYVMYQVVVEFIYMDRRLKDMIILYLKENKIIETSNSRIIIDDEILKQFVKRTCAHAKLSDEVTEIRYKYIKTKFDTLNLTQNFQSLFEDLSVYNLFFRIYLKGGMATRWICAYLNSLSREEQKKNKKSKYIPIFTHSMLNENLGDLSDYDFNCVINPEFTLELYDTFVEEIERIIQNAFKGFIDKRDFFRDTDVIGYMKDLALQTLRKIDELENNLHMDMRQDSKLAENLIPVNTQPKTCGFRSIVDVDGIFKLSRLMIGFQYKSKDRTSICYKMDNKNPEQATVFQEQIPGYKINILAELIDISFPSYNNNIERFVCWEYANKAIAVTWCNVYTDTEPECVLDFPNDQTELYRNTMTCIFIYSLDSIIHDLHITIQESIKRSETTKIAKREERLNFFKKIICLYNLLVYNTQYQTIYNDDLHTHCIDTAQLMFPTEFISKDVAMFIGSLTKDIPFKSNPANKSIASQSNPSGVLSYQNNIECMTLYIVRNYLVQILRNFKGLYPDLTPNRVDRSESTIRLQTFTTAYLNAYDHIMEILYKIDNNTSDILKHLNKIIANLFVNCISFHVSLNDNFITHFVDYYFIKRVMDVFTVLIHLKNSVRANNESAIQECNTALVGFDDIGNTYTKEVIELMEFLNHKITRPFVRHNIGIFTREISRALFDTYTEPAHLLIRGGYAVHLNLLDMYNTPNTLITSATANTYTMSDISTNDIDYMIQIPADKDDQTLENFKTRLYKYLNTTIIANSAQFPGATMSLAHPRTDLSQVIINYTNGLTEEKYKLKIPLAQGGLLEYTCPNLLPIISHHVVEILYRTELVYSANNPTIPDPYYTDVLEAGVKVGNPPVVTIAYLNKHSLLIEYNKILLQDLHWYRKAKYLRRIAALNGMIVDPAKRRNYEGEFPLPPPAQLPE